MGAQDSAPGDQPWVFALETGISSSLANPEHDNTTTPRQLRIQRGRPRHAMEERGKLQKSTQEPFSPPISNAKAPRRTAPALARAARRRETQSAAASEPNGSQSKTQRANPFGDARRPLHHGIILLRRLCGMASPGGCRFAARQCSSTATFEVGQRPHRPCPYSLRPDSKLTWGLGVSGRIGNGESAGFCASRTQGENGQAVVW